VWFQTFTSRGELTCSWSLQFIYFESPSRLVVTNILHSHVY
jgi:hypothetical protein